MSLAIESTAPGVIAIVNAGQVSRPFRRQPTSTAFVIGFASWGPIGVPKTVTSWPEFKRVFGGFHALGWLADTAKIFFDLYRGSQIVAIRAAGEDAEAATVTINDRVGSPNSTFKFDAKYPSSTVDISVKISDVAGSTAVCDVRVESEALGIVETYKRADLREAGDIATINEKSKLVTLSLADDVVSGATGRPAAGTFELEDGTDDSGSVDPEDLGAYLELLQDEQLGTGQVLIPGYGAANQAALVAHAENYNRLALIDPELGEAYTDVVDDLGGTPSSYAAAYFPWVEMPKVDGTSGRKFYPPTIFAAGECAKADRTIGTHKAPANLSTVPGAVDVERNEDGTSVINDNVRAVLNQGNINAIAPIAGEGIKVYGARVLAPAGETRIQFVHERRMLNLIYYTAKQGYKWAVFAVVDPAGKLFRDLRSAGTGFLRNLWQDGALYGKTQDEAFVVIADESNNPEEDLAQGRVHVQLGVKLSPTAEQITVNIDNVPLGQDLSVLNGGDN